MAWRWSRFVQYILSGHVPETLSMDALRNVYDTDAMSLAWWQVHMANNDSLSMTEEQVATTPTFYTRLRVLG